VLPQGGKLLHRLDRLVGALGKLDGDLRTHELLSQHTTFRVGGPAGCLFRPSAIDGFREAVDLCRSSGVRWKVIGNGSNLLFSDSGFNGVILSTRSLDRIEMEREGDELRAVRCACGVMVDRMIVEAERAGCMSLNFLAGIPGTVGGAVTMNAGPRDLPIGRQVLSVEWIDAEGQLQSADADACRFGYRDSLFRSQDAIITSVRLSCEGESYDREAILDGRRLRQPVDVPSAGCVFRNPVGDSAGRLIDRLGLKGLAWGGARVSEKHGNFIINHSRATSAEIRMVIDILRQKVYNGSHILLDLEIEVIDG